MPESIQSLVESFASQLEVLIRQQALDQITAALGNGAAPARRGRKPGKKTGRGPGRPASGAAVDPDRLLAHVKANPGQRGEQIAAALASDVKRIRPAMLKLIAAKQVRTTGQRRGMTYHAGAARIAAKTGKKRGKRRGKQ